MARIDFEGKKKKDNNKETIRVTKEAGLDHGVLKEESEYNQTAF